MLCLIDFKNLDFHKKVYIIIEILLFIILKNFTLLIIQKNDI